MDGTRKAAGKEPTHSQRLVISFDDIDNNLALEKLVSILSLVNGSRIIHDGNASRSSFGSRHFRLFCVSESRFCKLVNGLFKPQIP